MAPKMWGEEFNSVAGTLATSDAFTVEGAYAVVCIDGPLDQHCGGPFDNYDGIRERVSAALESPCQTVVLRISSPGGDFAGAIELARDIRVAATAARKSIVAFTDSRALSAGYVLACAAEHIVITPSAYVGSIGVWAALVDETMRDRAQGLNIAIVASGERKVDRNPHVPLTEEAIAASQVEVNAMADLFFGWVSETRNIDNPAGLQGKEVFGAEAVSYGLADRTVNSWHDFVSMQYQTMSVSNDSAAANAGSKMPDFTEQEKSLDEALAAMKAVEGDDDDSKKARKALRAKAKKALDAMGEDGAPADEKAADDDGGDEEKKDDADKAASAEDDDKMGKAAAYSKPRLVAASTTRELELVGRVHALEVAIAAKEESSERAALLAKRPDFSPQVKKSLASADLPFVRNAVANWERGTAPTTAAASATVPGGIRGETQGEAEGDSADDMVSYIDRRMGFGASKGPGVTRRKSTLELGFLNQEQARAELAKLNAKGSK